MGYGVLVPPPYRQFDVLSRFITDCVGGAIAGTRIGADLHMTAVAAQAPILSRMSDTHDVPLETEVTIDDAEYNRLMRGIAVEDGAPVVLVSAFQSSN
jgi:hypothetical protein